MNKSDLSRGDPITHVKFLSGDLFLHHVRVESIDTGDTFSADVWSNIKLGHEGLSWVRGHIPLDGDKANELRVAYALKFL